jgi:hypothetical protein
MRFRLSGLLIPALVVVAAEAGCSSSSLAPAAAESTPDADVGCPTDTAYAGDSMCLPAPTAVQGFQLHYGPSTYSNAAAMSPYVLPPNDETVDCYYEKSPNTSDVYVGGYEFSMRPGSHHLNVDINTVAQADGFHPCEANDQAPGLLGGTQTPKVDEVNDPAPENAGLAVKLPANSQVVLDFHVLNATQAPILREAWLNYYFIDQSQVKGLRGNVFLTGGLGFRIEPGTSQTYTYSCSPDRPARILSLAAHMHTHATRMTAWKVSGGTPSLVYENYDWDSPAELRYDSVHQNTPPNDATRTPGGSTGQLIVNPGDTIQWACDVDNTSDKVLTFRNEVQTGEMCILTGTMVPADNPMEADDFVCNRN